MRKLLIIGLVIVFSLLSTETTIADDNEQEKTARAAEFVNNLTNHVFSLLDDPAISDDQKRETLGKLIRDNVNIDVLTRLMLAREYRQTATSEQLMSYDNLSRKFIIDLFIERMGQLGKRKLEVVDVSLSRRGDSIVRTRLRKKDGEPVDVDWRVRDTAEGPRIINLSANGVSIVIVKRAEFSDIVRNDGFDALLKIMRDNVQEENAVAG